MTNKFWRVADEPTNLSKFYPSNIHYYHSLRKITTEYFHMALYDTKFWKEKIARDSPKFSCPKFSFLKAVAIQCIASLPRK